MWLRLYLLIALALVVSLRRVGPWWQVLGGSLAWPAIPLAAVISKLCHMHKRKHQ